MGTESGVATGGRPVMGRPRVTSRAVLERLAFDLFARQGFDATTVDDIAAAAGIGRRTLFRYVASKNDLVWGDFEQHLGKLRRLLDASDPRAPMTDALRRAVVEFNRFDPREVPWHRQRMELILGVPTLQADATLRFASWRAVVAGFVAKRTGIAPSAMVPRLAGHVLLGASLTAHELWLEGGPDADLSALLDTAIRRSGAGLAALLEGSATAP
ncbi:mycofactocin system transcriptional regulator [Nocardiopsis mangrovi]|uniref:Mycofactocin system transcriptional regulator n=1 Tax=Nocardiopsis mangrovi TaxID=1179818 RepID=A0ABV9E5P9_9ACTN